ncbi:MAG: hypothetical protein Q7R85_02365 [bacterium]|nr:hypothetical protein [bacterium]
MGTSNLTRRAPRREACGVRREIAEGIDKIRVALEDDSRYLYEVCDCEFDDWGDDFFELPRDDPYPNPFENDGEECGEEDADEED